MEVVSPIILWDLEVLKLNPEGYAARAGSDQTLTPTLTPTQNATRLPIGVALVKF